MEINAILCILQTDKLHNHNSHINNTKLDAQNHSCKNKQKNSTFLLEIKIRHVYKPKFAKCRA